jgi:phosphotriesterase-related protein
VKVTTVLGSIEPEDLGNTSVSEHLVCDAYWITGYVDYLLNDEQLVVEELAAFVTAGGQALVEPTNGGLRRKPLALKRIAEATGVHIIMGCGWYRSKHYPPEIERRSTLDLAEQMIGELTAGVDGTGIRAGIIGEIGVTLDYVSPAEERVLRAAARAHKATGAAIYVSSEFHPVGLDQLEILQEEGVDLNRVVVGHADSYLDLDYHEAITRQGAYAAYDGIGQKNVYPDERRVAMIRELLGKGYSDRIVLACGIARRSQWRAYGGAGYGHLWQAFLPMLRQSGVAAEQIQLLTSINPARVLAF